MSDSSDALVVKQAYFAQLDGIGASDDPDVNRDDIYRASVAALSCFDHRCKVAGLQEVESPCDTQLEVFCEHRRYDIPPSSLICNGRLRQRPMESTFDRRFVDKEEAGLQVSAQPEIVLAPPQSVVAREEQVLDRTAEEVIRVQDTPILGRGGKVKPTVPVAAKSTTSCQGKRKRTSIFRGLLLSISCHMPSVDVALTQAITVFIPVDETNQLRRRRISLAIEHGASRALQFSEEVTHIIADRHVGFMDILKVLGLDERPPSVIVVSENYTADCIEWKQLRDPTQPRYQVRGMPSIPIVPKPAMKGPVLQDISDTSLQLKSDKQVHAASHETNTTARTIETRSSQQPRAASSQETGLIARVSADTIRREPCDALQKAISAIKAIGQLPVSSAEDSDAASSNGENPDGNDVNETQDPSKEENVAAKVMADGKLASDNFQCMQRCGRNDGKNPNSRTIAILQEMQNYYHSIREEWRSRAYRLAIGQLCKQSHRITSAEEAATLPNIGSRLALKIEEIVWTDRLQRLEHAKKEPTNHALSTFVNIYGVGIRQASKWVQEGHRTLDDLLASPGVNLTRNQRIGIDHYEDFKLRIPRDETRKLGSVVERALRAIDPNLEMIIGGSYRRGAADSGDVDLIITKPEATAAHLCQIGSQRLVPYLEQIGFLTAALAVTSDVEGSKWHGTCQLPENPDTLSLRKPNDPSRNVRPWRRIDFLYVPWDELGAAMIYFTGNDIFNRSMRLLARKKGWRLNQRRLYKDVLRRGSTKLNNGTKISGNSERDIFELLGVPWRDERSRDC